MIVSLKAEPTAFSMDDSTSVSMPSAAAWPKRLMRTARGATR
jgi:hypothetical protein